MQDPASRIYDPLNHWGNDYDPRKHVCYVSGQNFVRAKCDIHYLCECPGFSDVIHLAPCENCYDCAQCHNPTAHSHAIVIATDGACRNNGRPDAVAACGVFFNVDSYHNKAFKMDDPRPTSQRAELRAAIYALGAFTKMLINNHVESKGYVTEVIIKSDSAYLVNGMTSWIVNWRQNGYLNSRGHPLKNQGLFRLIDRLCNNLDMMGIQARFWRVPRHENQQADKLANAALDGTRWKHLTVDDCLHFQPAQTTFLPHNLERTIRIAHHKDFLASAVRVHHPNERWWNSDRSPDYARIATDGACRYNGHANAIAGCGVFWGHNSAHNKSFQLRDGFHPTNQRAELTAAIQALKDFKQVFSNGGYRDFGPVRYVVIKTDSSYLVNSITNWIVEWRRYGWVNFNGEPVSNKDLITELDGLCRDIDYDLGVQACFWQVGRDENKDADRLAKAAIR